MEENQIYCQSQNFKESAKTNGPILDSRNFNLNNQNP